MWSIRQRDDNASIAIISRNREMMSGLRKHNLQVVLSESLLDIEIGQKYVPR